MALFCLSYASLAFTGSNIWCLPADVAPTPSHVASLAGIQNFSSGVAGALTTSADQYAITKSARPTAHASRPASWLGSRIVGVVSSAEEEVTGARLGR